MTNYYYKIQRTFIEYFFWIMIMILTKNLSIVSIVMNNFYTDEDFDQTNFQYNMKIYFDKYIYIIIKFNRKVNGIYKKINKNKLLFII